LAGGDCGLNKSRALRLSFGRSQVHVTIPITVQPILYYNFQHGWYFRSDDIMQFNTYSDTNVVPVGLGIGKVVQLEGGYVLNGYVEVQPSVFRSGRGAPDLQIEAGIQIQFPTSFTSGWKF
jgi:hypothetical protein